MHEQVGIVKAGRLAGEGESLSVLKGVDNATEEVNFAALQLVEGFGIGAEDGRNLPVVLLGEKGEVFDGGTGVGAVHHLFAKAWLKIVGGTHKRLGRKCGREEQGHCEKSKKIASNSHDWLVMGWYNRLGRIKQGGTAALFAAHDYARLRQLRGRTFYLTNRA